MAEAAAREFARSVSTEARDILLLPSSLGSWSASGNVAEKIGTRMRVDDDRDLAEQVESALRALGIAATRSCDERGDSLRQAVSSLRDTTEASHIEASQDETADCGRDADTPGPEAGRAARPIDKAAR
ncbi:hypothetical protein [Jiella mangrovi]|uniref:Uncharacterized protein n=1 Tax=Jiella mangrovi TaxID=2821407 RepID=A0ABS4BBE9_9HYPH|nr:hypothetical protein [Jiella mangrovi]MBP0614056.1 hypothetical protein [Jiella mangrovi]